MDIDTLKKLAGINEFQGYTEYKIDENPSITATALKKKEKKMGLKPGDPSRLNLSYSKPYLTAHVTFRGRQTHSTSHNEQKLLEF